MNTSCPRVKRHYRDKLCTGIHKVSAEEREDKKTWKMTVEEEVSVTGKTRGEVKTEVLNRVR